jgi:uncharacterized protein
MKIDARQIPPEGLVLEQQIDPAAWGLDTDFVKFRESLRLTARFSKITNAVTALIEISGRMFLSCSRCLNEFGSGIAREIRIDYPVNSSQPIIDFDPEIRDQLILGYPVKPLCRQDCRGLCPKCGKDLNQGSCDCNKN